jgi:hypothetical protein
MIEKVLRLQHGFCSEKPKIAILFPGSLRTARWQRHQPAGESSSRQFTGVNL